MSRFPSFVAGLLVGAVMVYVSLKFHIVRANDGFHMIPKLSAEFGETYVDIRQFNLTDWDDHPSLAIAITRADKGELLQNSASESLRHAVDGVLNTLNGSRYGTSERPLNRYSR